MPSANLPMPYSFPNSKLELKEISRLDLRAIMPTGWFLKNVSLFWNIRKPASASICQLGIQAISILLDFI
jgi:hypothetical protein